jgi:flagellar biosynthesis protein FlhA
MAIDADLSAGIIDENEARRRRSEIMREADFYGAMDGASKFVRGDAIAGIVITVINVAGGFAIGAFEKGWSVGESLLVFTRLTIGDGLVSQVPAFIIAVAAGLIVARAGGKTTLGEQIPAQLAAQPMALYLIAGFLGLLAFTPLPALPLLAASGVVGAVAWSMGMQKREAAKERTDQARREAAAPREPAPVEELLAVDTLELEIGYGLVQIVDGARGGGRPAWGPASGADLLDRIAMIRRQLAAEIGIVVPPIRIRDNMQLDPNLYRVKLRGAVVGEGKVYPDLLMAMDSGLVTERVEGIAGREPAFGLAALWIDPALKPTAERRNYTVVDAVSVVATHLTEVVKEHAAELLTREEVSQLLDQLRKAAPKLVEETIPSIIRPGELQKILQNLLRERVPIRDLETIVETLGDWAPHTKDVAVLTEYVRNALRRTISAMHAEADERGRPRLACVTLDPGIEDVVNGYIDRGPAGTSMAIPPPLAARIARAVAKTAEPLVAAGRPLVVLTSPTVRAQIKQILDAHVPGAAVLSYNEVVKDLDVESLGLVHLPPDRDGQDARAAASPAVADLVTA